MITWDALMLLTKQRHIGVAGPSLKPALRLCSCSSFGGATLRLLIFSDALNNDGLD